jgi:hypothetical protein
MITPTCAVVAVVLCAAGVLACIHDTPAVQRAVPIPAAAALSRQRLATAQATRSPIRFAFDHKSLYNASSFCNASGVLRDDLFGSMKNCTAADVFTDAKRSILLDRILPAAASQLENALSVDPLSQVDIGTGCSLARYAFENSSYPNVDIAIAVLAAPTASGTLAFATPCKLDSTTGRPIVGMINFGPASLGWAEEGSYANADSIATAVHELIHALGFSSSLINAYWPSGTVAKTVLRGKNATVVQSDKVLATTRAYFNCTTAQGAELEDEGSAGSAGSHWDRRILPFETMAPSGGIYLSNFTLSFLEDSGWYTANYAAATDQGGMIPFAQDAGCGFLQQLCNTSAGGKGDEFCFDSGEGCTTLRRSVGYCDVAQRSTAFPAVFQYFNDPKRGGSTFFDGCPIIADYGDLRCSFNRTLTTSDRLLGHYFGSSGRCFKTTGTSGSTGLAAANIAASGSPYRCLEAQCVDGRLFLRPTGASEWAACPADGSTGSIDAPTGFTGTIECPAATLCVLDPSLAVGTPTPSSGTTTAATSTTSSGATTTTTDTSTTTTTAGPGTPSPTEASTTMAPDTPAPTPAPTTTVAFYV